MRIPGHPPSRLRRRSPSLDDTTGQAAGFVPWTPAAGYAPSVQLIIRLVVNAIALWVATLIVTGIDIDAASTQDEVLTILAVAVVFAVVNVLVRPIVRLFSLPLYVLTLGLFTLVVNALMLLLTSWIADLLNVPFTVDGFWAALLGGLVVSFVSWVLNLLLPE